MTNVWPFNFCLCVSSAQGTSALCTTFSGGLLEYMVEKSFSGSVFLDDYGLGTMSRLLLKQVPSS